MGKLSLIDKLRKKKKELAERGKGGDYFFFKADTERRLRPVNVGEDEEWYAEVVYFFLGQEIKGYISPRTVGKPCAVHEYYEEMRKSKDEDDNEFAANSMKPGIKWLVWHYSYKDLRGKEIDVDAGVRAAMLSKGLFEELVDKFMDEDEWGDFTDIKSGYDIKYKRVGSGKQDTKYSLTPCKNTKASKPFNKVYDLDKMLGKLIPTYEQSEDILKRFLNIDSDDDDGGTKIKKKKKGVLKTKSKKKKKKKRSRD